MTSKVTATPPAEPLLAKEHFSRKLTFETDCSDVHEALMSGAKDFVLLDVRSRDAYAKAHVPGAVSLPHWEITSERLAAWPEETMFVTYCAGPQCNGADKGAYKLSMLGRRVKIMIGGVVGWRTEGFPFEAEKTRGVMSTALS
jgi:rhodanese-related sulfurtransferase